MASKNTATASIHIIGIGSSLGADQLGLLAANKLDEAGFQRQFTDGLIHIDTCLSPAFLTLQYTPESSLILLDAYCSSDPVASVRRFSLRDLETVQQPDSSHRFDIKQALALSQSLNGEKPTISIIGICAGAKPGVADTQTADAILNKAFPKLLNTVGEAIYALIKMPVKL